MASSLPGSSPGQDHGPAGALLHLLTLSQEFAVLVYNGVDARLTLLQQAVSSRLRLIAEAVNRVLARIAAFPPVLYRRAVVVAGKILAFLYLVFVAVPKWLVQELPRRVLATLLSIAHAIRAFLTNEVVPTAEFFVEVPPALLGATMRDLFVRTPLWLAVRGPGAIADFAKTVFFQLGLVLVAMFDRARGLVQRLIDGALLVWDTLQGGLHWIAILLFMQLAPWLVNLGFEAFDTLVLFVNAVIIFIVAARRWIWRTILSIPHFIATVIQEAISLIAQALHAVVEALTWLIRTMPRVVEAILRGIRDVLRFLLIGIAWNFARLVWQAIEALPRLAELILREVGNVLHVLLIELPRDFARLAWRAIEALPGIAEALVRAVADMLTSIARGLWDLAINVLRLVLIEVPKLLWNVVESLFRAAWSLGDALIRFAIELPGRVWQLVVFLFVTLPRETARAIATLVTQIARALAEPTLTVLTWTLALLISPFYFLAKLLGLGGGGRLSGHGR